MNENKLTEENLRRNVQLISANNNMINNTNLVNNLNRTELGVDVDSSSNSENNSSSQPSSKVLIQRLFRKKTNSTNSEPTTECTNHFGIDNLMKRFLNLKNTVQKNKFFNYFKCFESTDHRENATNHQFTNQFLNSQLNPIFIDQLDSQETSIKDCAFRQYSSTLKPNQISLVRLQNQQRAARLIRTSNYHFNQQLGQLNQYDEINQLFLRHQLLTNSMRSDSLLMSTRRQMVREQLIKKIKKESKIESNGESSYDKFLASKTKTNSNETKPSDENNDSKKDAKQFYYFAQHCLTLPQNSQQKKTANLHQIDCLMQPDTFEKSSDILNISDSASSSSDKSSSYNSKNSKVSNDSDCGLTATSNCQFVNKIDLENKQTNRTLTTTADIHLNKNLKNTLHSNINSNNNLSSNLPQTKINVQFDGDRKNASNINSSESVVEGIGFRNKQNFDGHIIKSTKSNRSNLIDVKSMDSDSKSNLKYIVIDDTVFVD